MTAPIEIAARTAIAIRIGTSGEEPPPSLELRCWPGADLAVVARRRPCRSEPLPGLPWPVPPSLPVRHARRLFRRWTRLPKTRFGFRRVRVRRRCCDRGAAVAGTWKMSPAVPLTGGLLCLRSRSEQQSSYWTPLESGLSKTGKQANASRASTDRSQRGERPESGPGGGASHAWRARLEQTAALIAPVALIVGLALAGGGFDVSTRHIAGLAVWLVVVGLLVLGRGVARDARAAVLLGSRADRRSVRFLSAFSSLWSGSVELSVIEADRVLVYLGFFLAAFLIAQTDQRRQRFAEGIAIAVDAGRACWRLASRLLPHVLDVGDSLGQRPAACAIRSATGTPTGSLFGIAIAMLLWMSRALAGRRCAGSRSRRCRRSCWPSTSPTRAAACWRCVGRLRLPARPLPRPALAAGDAGDRRDRGAAGGARGAGAPQPRRQHRRARRPSTRGSTVLLILLAGTPLALRSSRRLRRLERRGGAADRPRAGALAQPARAEARRAGRRRWSRSAPRSPSAAAPGTSSPASDVQFPSQPRAALHPALRQPAATNSGGSRSTPSAKSRCSGTGPAPTASPGTSCARSTCRCSTPTRSTSRPSPSSGSSAACSSWRWSGRCSGPASPPGARRRTARASRYAALLAAMLAFAVGAGVRLVLGDRRRWARSSSSPPGSSSPPAARSSAGCRRRHGRGAAPLRAGGRRPRGRLDRGAGAGRPAAGRPRDRRQPERGGRRQPRQRGQPRRNGPLDRALCGLALRAARPAGGDAGRLPDRRRTPDASDRPRRPQLAALLPTL